MSAAPDAYRRQAVATATPAQLVLMMYDAAIMGIARATAATERGVDGIETVNRELQRAQDIVTELLVTLDLERGGQVAKSMASLYDFCLDRLIRANIRKDMTLLEPASTVLKELRDAWEVACCQPAMPTPAVVSAS